MQSESNIRCLFDGLRGAIDILPEPGDDPTDGLILNSAAQALEWVLGETRSGRLMDAFDAMALSGALAKVIREKPQKDAPNTPRDRA